MWFDGEWNYGDGGVRKGGKGKSDVLRGLGWGTGEMMVARGGVGTRDGRWEMGQELALEMMRGEWERGGDVVAC